MKSYKNTVSVIGLGFVGSAMAVVINSIKKNNKKLYKVIGIEKNNLKGKNILKKLNNGIFPFPVNDKTLIKKTKNLKNKKNFIATNNLKEISKSKIIICSINFDILKIGKKFKTNSNQFISIMKKIALNINENSTLIIESTLPPGFSENEIIPLFKKIFLKRKIDTNKVKIAYSFERVMPGKEYYNSIKNMHRVYSANNKQAEKDCKNFFENLINTKKFPLIKMKNIRSVELTKVIENSYRASNIAFMQEWTKFSEKLNVNLNEVINAIKVRPTHSNIMRPGLGVGGYCLTKDSLLAMYSSKKIYKNTEINFPFSELAIKTNVKMPIHTIKVIKKLTKQKLNNKKVLIYGASYKNDIGDTRYSPSEILYENLKTLKCFIKVCDPFVKFWKELNINVKPNINKIEKYDLIIFAVNHKEFRKINLNKLTKKNIVIETGNVLSRAQISTLKKNKAIFYKIGQGKY